MSKHVLEVCDSLKEAVKVVKNRLNQMDEYAIRAWNWRNENFPEKTKGKTMEEENWDDKLYLVYCADDDLEEKCWIFRDDYDIKLWLNKKWLDWNLWELDDIEGYLSETVVIWEFHRDVSEEKLGFLYRNSKPFIKGWSKKRRYVRFEFVPSFAVGW